MDFDESGRELRGFWLFRLKVKGFSPIRMRVARILVDSD